MLERELKERAEAFVARVHASRRRALLKAARLVACSDNDGALFDRVSSRKDMKKALVTTGQIFMKTGELVARCYACMRRGCCR